MTKQKNTAWTKIILIILGLIGTIALMTLLVPCGPKEDGTYMHCHTVGNILQALAAVSALLALLSWFLKKRTFSVIADLGILAAGILMIALPGHIMSLCMMPEMRCRAIMQPGALVIGILLAAAALVDLIFAGKK